MAIIQRGEAIENFETTICRKDNKHRTISWHSRNLTDAAGQPIGSIAFGRDVTTTKLLEAQLAQAQKMEAVGTLASGIAHDFNNLLQAINGYAQILLLSKEKNDPEYTNLNAIFLAGERAAQLVQQLLLFSRKVTAERRTVDLNREVEQTRRILERTIPKMIAIELDLGQDVWPVMADSVQIEQILLNLGVNAADAMPDGGKLLIETRNVRLGDRFVKTLPGIEPGKYVLTTVSDTGQGMDSKTVEHIFEPFFTTKEVGKGTGLGLASAYGIIKNHDGHITCSSEPGQGTTFKVYLPAARHPRDDSTDVTTERALEGGCEIILLVDDEEAITSFSSEVLKRYGYTVFIASNGEDALTIYKEQSAEIGLVILDIGMPGMGGYKCLREILGLNASAKVMVASGYAIDGQVREALDAGAAGYIGKPYNMTDLLREVRAVLDQR